MKASKAFTILFMLFLKCILLFGQQGEWTWMKGDSMLNNPGHYGIQGIPNQADSPPALYESNGWVDQSGDLWLFGGLSYYGNYSDLWKYDVSDNLWVWVNGPGILNQPAVYGTQGIPSVSNTPGDHHGLGFVTWVDLQGDFWLMGGSLANGGSNDVWRYHVATSEWTWMKGSQIIGDPGHYGTNKIPDPANNPPGRDEVRCGWTDDNGNFWLFGGASGSNNFNDLWRYDLNTNQWTWMHGSNTPNQPGNYGVLSVPAPQNTPGARWPYAHWKDSDGKFWLFGGGNQFNTTFNDLWRFDPQTFEWTWISGTNLTNQPGVCNGICQSSIDNIPVSRYENSACWKGICDFFYLFGGRNPKSSALSSIGDLWSYDRFTNEWTFIKGSLTTDLNGIHGMITVPGPANHPRSLYGSGSWTDPGGNFWLFGGRNSNAEFCNELWRYKPGVVCPQGNAITTVNITNDTAICLGQSIQLFASGGNTYQWTPVSNISNPNVPNPTVHPDHNTTYSVLISAGSCHVTVSVNVKVITDSAFSVYPNDTLICKGDTIDLMATGGNTYQWQPADHLNDAGIPNPIAFPDITTAYTIAITDVYGCHASKSILITVDDLPLFQISPSEPSICLGSSVGLSASGALTYQWSPKQDLTFSSGSLVIAAPQKSITYMVTGIDQYGCSYSTSVKINVIDCILDIPNVFTPNGDGKNDFFKVIYVGVTDYNIQIFSRWGSKLFESSKVEDPWDGKSHGIDISEGTYFYLITIGDNHYSGSIALIR